MAENSINLSSRGLTSIDFELISDKANVDLGRNEISNPAELAKLLLMPNLQTLDIKLNHITKIGPFEPLAAHLKQIDVNGNKLDYETILLLLNTPSL